MRSIFDVLRRVRYLKADNIPLSQSHAQNERLHVRAHVVDDGTDMAQVLENKIAGLFNHNRTLANDRHGRKNINRTSAAHIARQPALMCLPQLVEP